MFLRVCVMGMALLGLAGCDTVTNRVTDGIAAISGPGDSTTAGIRTLSLLNGDVRVRGPEGYCVDQSASNARRGFSVMVGCAVLTDEAAIMPRLDGLITVQFGAENTASVAGNEEAFAAFLASDAGRGLLSQGGDAATISEIATVTDNAGVLVRFTDAAGPAFEGTDGPQWRGFMDVNGRLTTVSALSFARNPLTRAQAERLLIVAMTELAEVNGAARDADKNT